MTAWSSKTKKVLAPTDDHCDMCVSGVYHYDDGSTLKCFACDGLGRFVVQPFDTVSGQMALARMSRELGEFYTLPLWFREWVPQFRELGNLIEAEFEPSISQEDFERLYHGTWEYWGMDEDERKAHDEKVRRIRESMYQPRYPKGPPVQEPLFAKRPPAYADSTESDERG